MKDDYILQGVALKQFVLIIIFWGLITINMIVYRNGSKFLDYESIEDTKFKLLILPVYYYNFSPEVGKQYSLNFIKQKKVLHFKGNRKKYFSLRNL